MHDQAIAKLACVYESEFSDGLLKLNVEQHQKEHEDTPINLSKVIANLIQADIFVATENPAWMVHLDKNCSHSLKVSDRSELACDRKVTNDLRAKRVSHN